MPFQNKGKPIIHSGHFLRAKLSKADNEELLRTLEKKNYSLVNLTLDDLIIAHSQDIKLESFQKLIFLNSSITDLDKDGLFSGDNIVPYYILNGTCFIGLSDQNLTTQLPTEHFLINDYALSILKAKQDAQKENPTSFVIIHKLGKDFESISERLPADFRALLTN
jgi:hypothetical protein